MAEQKVRPRGFWRPVVVAAGLLAVLAAAMACGGRGGSGADEPALERIGNGGVVRVGYANEAPYAYLDSASGELEGEAPAIARRIFGQMGAAEIEGVLTEFGSLIPALKAGRFDVIAAGMYIKPQRCREIDFSNPTYCIGEGFVVQAGNPLDLHSYEDLAAHPEARLGVVAGAVELGYARAVGVPDERIVVFPDAPSAVAGVQSGRVDAYGGTSLTVQDMLDKADDPGIERARPFTDPVIDGEPVRGCGAFGFRKGEDELRREVNRRLAELIGTPEHLELVRPYGFTEADLPGDLTAEELCRP